jgi:hypothetical protein
VKVQLATRLETPMRRRLRIYSALTGRTVEDLVGAALDRYLPAMSEMVRDGGAEPREDMLAEQPGAA